MAKAAKRPARRARPALKPLKATYGSEPGFPISLCHGGWQCDDIA
jgi:hypothetical protein